MVLSAGDRLGRYEILGQLGSGGMGEVYRATDTTLARDVAVKVLPDGVANDPGQLERFQLEARAIASLSHPNIMEIHDFGEHDGVQYAVTELLEGQTLRERIPASGLPWQRVVEIGAMIAAALAAAHGRGIVHRDVKPENVFVTSDGRVKVLDFGLARVQQMAQAEAPTAILAEPGTQTGTVLGTIGYLAPELAAGGTADARSDIFSLGCVLHEMVTGQRAFRRDTAAETLWATLREEPPLPSSLGAILPLELERAIARCLEKSPEARFQSAADLAFALRAIASGSAPRSTAPAVDPASTSKARRRRRTVQLAAALLAVAAVVAAAIVGPRLRTPATPTGEPLDPNRVVVVPFDNRTGDPANDVIGLLVADWMTQRLPETGGLKIIASSSAVAAQRLAGGRTASPVDIGRQVAAGTVVTGAYYRLGDQLQIKAEVVAADSGELLHDVAPVAGQIAEPMAVVEALRQRVLGVLAGRDPNITRFAPPTFEAYREYLAGREIWIEQPEAALEHYRRSSEIDPAFLPPRLWSVFALMDLGRSEDARTVLDDLDRRRQELDGYELSYVDAVRFYFEQRYLEALLVLRQIVAQDPLNPNLRSGLAQVALWTNHPREAVATLEGHGDWHGLGFPQLRTLGQALHVLGEHERELEVARLAVARSPAQKTLVFGLVEALSALGRTDEVAALVEGSFPAADKGRLWLAVTASVELRAHGQAQAAAEIAARTVARTPPDPSRDPLTSVSLALLLLFADRPDDARALSAELAASNPENVPVVGTAGAVAARLGDRAAALELARRLEQLASPQNLGNDSYCLACIAAELGDREEALELLRRALLEGTRFDLTFHCNPFFEPLRGFGPFNELLEPNG